MNKSNWLCVAALLICGFTWLNKGDVGAQVKDTKAVGRFQVVLLPNNLLPKLFVVDSATGDLWSFDAAFFRQDGHVKLKEE